MPTDYVPTSWVDNTTPVDAARMNHLEAGVDLATDAAPPTFTGQNGKWLKVAGGVMVWQPTTVAWTPVTVAVPNVELSWGGGESTTSGYISVNGGGGTLRGINAPPNASGGEILHMRNAGSAFTLKHFDGTAIGAKLHLRGAVDRTFAAEERTIFVYAGGTWFEVGGASSGGGAGGGVDYIGNWSGAVNYAQGSVVLYNGVQYIAVNTSLNQTPPALTNPTLGPTAISLVTALPSTPFDGQEVHFTDSLTTPTYVWHLRYVAAKATNKWVFVGGFPLSAVVATQESTTSTSYVALATVGPAITLPVAGIYLVTVTAGCFPVGGLDTAMAMSFDIGATGAVDANALILHPASAGTTIAGSGERTTRVTVAAATTLTSKYRTLTGGNTVAAREREIRAVPIAVGG